MKRRSQIVSRMQASGGSKHGKVWRRCCLRPTNLSMSTDTGRNRRDSKRTWARRSGWAAVALVIGAAGLYEYQPQRYDLFPRPAPTMNPWTDPDSARLFAPGARVTIVTAHPDDAEFYIGGLLTRLAASGAHLSLIVTTDGDKGYYPFENAAENRRIRRLEQTEAARQWQAESVSFLA